MDLFLIRHGETDSNANGIIQGWLDTELNERGLSQAAQAVESFDEAIDAIYCSDLKRAKQTAAGFREKYPDVPYFEDDRLRERNFGDANGDRRDNHDWEVFWASSKTVSIPNAETLDEFSQRVRLFLASVKESGYSKVLVVTHGGTINRFQDLTSDNHEPKDHGNAVVMKLSI